MKKNKYQTNDDLAEVYSYSSGEDILLQSIPLPIDICFVAGNF